MRAAQLCASISTIDQHFYVTILPFRCWQLPSSSRNDNLIKTNIIGGTQHAFSRHYGKPFTVTEFNYWRRGSIAASAASSRLPWGAARLGGIWRLPTRMAITSFSSLPAWPILIPPATLNQAADRATVCLYLRGDMTVAEKAIALSMPGITWALHRFSHQEHLAPL